MTLAAVIVIAGAIWVLRLIAMPEANCRRCEGTGHNFATRLFGGGRKRRRGPCGKCGGSGRRWVLGARTAHKALGGMRSARQKRKR
jgi:DnaJ-class molecular chaperone